MFEVIAEVTLAKPPNLLPEATPPESFGFISTFEGESFSCAVIPNGSGHLSPEKPTQVRLRFLAPEVASKIVRPGKEFSFFEQHRIGTGHVLSVHYA